MHNDEIKTEPTFLQVIMGGLRSFLNYCIKCWARDPVEAFAGTCFVIGFSLIPMGLLLGLILNIGLMKTCLLIVLVTYAPFKLHRWAKHYTARKGL